MEGTYRCPLLIQTTICLHIYVAVWFWQTYQNTEVIKH